MPYAIKRLRQLIRDDSIQQEEFVDSFHRLFYRHGIKQITDSNLNARWQLMIGIGFTNQRTDFCATLQELRNHYRTHISRCSSN
jgi:hypothetical protein